MAESFNERCYTVLKKVPKGRVTTYKEIAEVLGSKGYRAVGNAMNKNPNAPKVPCHRVVRSDGSLGGYAFGLPKKVSLLKSEGITFEGKKVQDMPDVLITAKELKQRLRK